MRFGGTGSRELQCWTVLHVARPRWLQPRGPPGGSCTALACGGGSEPSAVLGSGTAWQWDLACAEPCCEAGRAELRRTGLGTSFPRRGHSVWRVPCCVAAEGDHQDSHRDLVSQWVAVQDQLSCLPWWLTGLPCGCPGSQAPVCRHCAQEQAPGMRMVSVGWPLAHGPWKGSPGLLQPPAPVAQLSLPAWPLRHQGLPAERGVPVTSHLPGAKG